MTSANQYVPIYIADYLDNATHLTTTEYAAYLLLVMHYRMMGSLPDDDSKLAKIVRCSDRQWAAMRTTIAELFEEGWKQPRRDIARRAK